MKRRLAVLVSVAALLSVCLVVDWRNRHPPQPKPSIENLDFIPVIRGLKAVTGSGDLERGRSDTFFINRPFEDLRREMRSLHWKEENGQVFSRFTASEVTSGYGMLVVLVMSWVMDWSKPKGWCQVQVLRRIAPISAREQIHSLQVQSRNNVVKDRIDRIRDQITRSHRFPASDREFLERAVMDYREGAYICRALAELTLVFAERAKLYKREELLAIVEKNMDRSDPGETGVSLQVYEGVFNFGARPTRGLNDDARLLRREDKRRDSVDEEERRFITRGMNSNLNWDNVLAANVFVPKRFLDSGTLSWLIGLVDIKLRTTTADANLFWTGVKRVVLVRNRAPASTTHM